MNANELIEQVSTCMRKNWKNSDIGAPIEQMLEQIREHYIICESCRNDFDGQHYSETTLIALSNKFLHNTDLEEWICENDTTTCRICTNEIRIPEFDIENDRCLKCSHVFDELESNTFNDPWSTYVGDQPIRETFDDVWNQLTFFDSTENDKFAYNSLSNYVIPERGTFFEGMNTDECEIIKNALVKYATDLIPQYKFADFLEANSNQHFLTDLEIETVQKFIGGTRPKLTDAERQRIQRIRKKRENILKLRERLAFFEKFNI